MALNAAAKGFRRSVFSTKECPNGASRLTQTSKVPTKSEIRMPYATVVATAVERKKLLTVALINIDNNAARIKLTITCLTCACRFG